MSTQRKLIRQRVITILEAANIVASGKVFGNRFSPVDDSELPAILVYSKDEKVSIYADSAREYERQLSLAVEVVAAGDTDVDDTLDDLCQKVEDVMTEDFSLGDLCGDTVLTEVELLISSEGQKNIGGARMTFEITYYALAVAITAQNVGSLDNLNNADTVYHAEVTDDASATAEDKINLT